jgi:hypothetical protein
VKGMKIPAAKTDFFGIKQKKKQPKAKKQSAA